MRNVSELESAILDGVLASEMIRGDRLIGIRVRYPARCRSTAGGLKSLLVVSPTGASLPLASLAGIGLEQGQPEIRRDSLRNFSPVAVHVTGRDLGSAMNEIRRRLFSEVEIPPGTDIQFSGLYELQRESFLGLVQVLLMSILLIFIILVLEFRGDILLVARAERVSCEC